MKRRLLLDTNLLVLLIAGSTDRKLIGTHKRLRAYTAADYDLLLHLCAEYSATITCPHILAETSNLLLGGTGDQSRRFADVFRKFIGQSEECSVIGTTAAAQAEFASLGITDAVILCLLAPETALLTADAQLCLAAQRAGRDARNFNHQRGY